MMELAEAWLKLGQTAAELLRQNPEIGFWIVCAASMFESLAFIGLIFPGGNFTIIVGLLAAFDYFGFWEMAVAATLGAVTGDVISFYLGKYAQKLFRAEARVFKLAYYERGRDFFKQHGGKSVFTGRFVGPIRPVIPFVAGMFNMNAFWFNFYNITSAVLWSLLFLGVGYGGGHWWKILDNWWLKLGLFLIPVIIVIGAALIIKKTALKQDRSN